MIRAWQRFQRLTQLGWPQRFPIAQFPNLPLIVAATAGIAHHFITGTTGRYLSRGFALAGLRSPPCALRSHST